MLDEREDTAGLSAASYAPATSDPPSGPADLWMVQAIIQPFKLDAVTRALGAVAGFSGMTVTAVRGFGHEKMERHGPGKDQTTPGEDVQDFTSKVRLDIAVAGRRRADDVIAVLARTAHTGNRGDGKIFAWPLERVLRVRTMEEGRDAV